MNRSTAPASPVRREAPVVAAPPPRGASQAVAERPQARTSAAAPRSRNRRRKRTAVAIAGIAAVAIVAVAYARCDRSPHRVASIAADPGPADAQIAADAASAAVEDPPPDAPEATDAAPSPPRPSPPTRGAPRSAPPAVVPPAIASELDLAERKLDAGDLDDADHHARATMMQHEYPRANVILAEVGCARHDLAQAHGFMRRAGAAHWSAIRKRCAMLGFAISDPD